jgi:hypothetical protein
MHVWADVMPGIRGPKKEKSPSEIRVLREFGQRRQCLPGMGRRNLGDLAD